MRIFVLVYIFLFFIGLDLYPQSAKAKVKEIKSYVEKSMQEWEIPGLAIGIIYNDDIVMSDGFGIQSVNTPKKKVDANTMFGIASNTKAFTATAIAILVDEGKLNWDDKVTKYLPYFKMYDPFVTENITIRDLLCHRSGLKTFSGDLLWNTTSYNRKDIISRIQYLEPTYGFRAHYGYSNVLFLTAGELVPAVTGMTYDEFLQKRIFEPLGMTNTNTSIKKHKEIENLAMPHVESDGEIIEIPYISWDNIAPAGAINSTVNDMLKWIKLQLHNGKLNDTEILSLNGIKEMRTPQTIQTVSPYHPSMHFNTYGLGWNMFDYRGRKIINHSGGLDGMISHVVFVPEENLGFVILTNSMNYLPYGLMYRVLDEFFNVEESEKRDWSNWLYSYYSQSQVRLKEDYLKAKENRNKNSKPSLPLDNYCGTYSGELYGDAIVEIRDNQLFLQFKPAPLFYDTLSHWEYDIFEVDFNQFPSLPNGKVNFIMNNKGEIIEMQVDVPNPDFDFTELKFIKQK